MHTLLATALVSYSGGVMGHGIFFLARERFQFTDAQSLYLAIALYVPYIPAALLSSSLAKIGLSRAIMGVTAAMALLALLVELAPNAGLFCLFAALFSGGAGALWPMLESGIAGNSTGKDLHHAIARFNLTWAVTLAPGLALSGKNDTLAILSVGVVQLAVLFLAPHIRALPHPPSHTGLTHYRPLLRASRVLLPVSYLLLDTFSPLLPGRWQMMGVPTDWAALLTSGWMVARFGIFLVLSKFTVWHGRRDVLVLGLGLLGVGFAGTVLVASPVLVVGGLIAFGIGQGIVYNAALYYGMEVGKGEVDAGGWHEAVVGLGYLGGPVLALLGMSLGLGPLPLVFVVMTLGFVASVTILLSYRGS